MLGEVERRGGGGGGGGRRIRRRAKMKIEIYLLGFSTQLKVRYRIAKGSSLSRFPASCIYLMLLP